MKSIRKMLNLVAQFMMKLEQAGLTKELLQKVITSKNNKLAKDIVKLIKGEDIVGKKITPKPIYSGKNFTKNTSTLILMFH